MLTAFEQGGKTRPVLLAYTRVDDAGFKQKLTDSDLTRSATDGNLLSTPNERRPRSSRAIPRAGYSTVRQERVIAVEIVLMFLLAFGIVGSVEARMRTLLKRHERQLDAVREDLARVERKLDGLLKHSGLHGTQPADCTRPGAPNAEPGAAPDRGGGTAHQSLS